MRQGRFPCEDEEVDEADDEVLQQQVDDDNTEVANGNFTHEERKKN